MMCRFLRHLHQSPDISPIDEIPDMSQLDMNRQGQGNQQQPSAQRSNIPMMRRERRKHQEAAATNLRESKSRDRLVNRPEMTNPVESSPGRSETKWDAMTGEPTTSSAGRSAQVNPSEYAQGFGQTPDGVAIQRSSVQQPFSFGERIRRLRPVGGGGANTGGADKAAPATTAQAQVQAQAPQLNTRPEWRGGSGRTTLVDPVRDTPEVAPLNIPRRSSKRGAAASRGGAGLLSSPLSPVSPSGSETSLGAAPTIRKVVPSSQQLPPPLSSPANRMTVQDYPSPPNSASQISHNNAAHESTSAVPNTNMQPQPLFSAPNTTTIAPANLEQKAIRRKPPPSAAQNSAITAAHNAHLSTSSSVYSYQPDAGNTGITSVTPPRQPPAPVAQQSQTGSDPWTQPPSRFSVTTYATSAHTGSPRPSVEDEKPPMPTPPKQSSVLDRKRPKVLADFSPQFNEPMGEPVVVSFSSAYMSSPYTTSPTGKKAHPAGPRSQPTTQARSTPRTNTMTSILSSNSGRPASIMSTTKALPPAPPEINNAHDRVGLLNAQLQSLANRRININKSIKQMTELMPTDNLMASEAVIRKREIEKLKVEALKQELAEVQREEYELGLKLHRAYKRMDKEAEFEPTNLWVRRVTG
jgi:hypothetical protein